MGPLFVSSKYMIGGRPELTGPLRKDNSGVYIFFIIFVKRLLCPIFFLDVSLEKSCLSWLENPFFRAMLSKSDRDMVRP